MVNRFGELSSVFTPPTAVTFCSVITPETGAHDIDHRRRMIDIAAQNVHPLRGVLHIDTGLVAVFWATSSSFWAMAPLFEQQLARSSCARASVSSVWLCENPKRRWRCRRSARASEAALGHWVAQARPNFHDPARSQRNHRNVPRNIGGHHAGDVQLGRR